MIEVDGDSPFEQVAQGWKGFDPGEFLGPERPLHPTHIGRRVAVYRCSCGEPGCGVIAPYITRSADGRQVTWADFRNYIGVFRGPVVDDADRFEGRAWDLPAIHFDAGQYAAEVLRATADRSWETPRRTTARWVEARLREAGFAVVDGFALDWVSPAHAARGVDLSFLEINPTHGLDRQQILLQVAYDDPDPHEAAKEVVRRLTATAPKDRIREFGWVWPG